MSETVNNRLNRAAQDFLAQFAALSSAALEARPAPDAWSRRQVVEHILLAYISTIRAMEYRLAKGAPTSRPRSWKARFWQFVIIDCGYFPPGRKAPDAVDPVQHELPLRDAAELAAEFRRLLGEMEAAINQVEAAWGSRVAVATHMRLGPLSAPQWRGFHAVHTRHHAKQMRRIAAQSPSTFRT